MPGRGARASAALIVVMGLGLALPVAAEPPADHALLAHARLRLGDRGPTVAALQRALAAAGEPVAIDGVFGGETWAAVRRFQAANGCVVDGVVGAETLAALDRALGATTPPAAASTSIPPRAPSARTGSQVMAGLHGVPRATREAVILQELRAGNVPSFLRAFRPVTASGGGRTVTIQVLPDYLAIGDDADFVRVSLGSAGAQRAADAFGCQLPTTRIVDLAFAQAAVRLAPRPLPPGPTMMSVEYLLRHERLVEGQRRGHALGLLTAGHKKDVVLTNRLLARPDRVAIYGWHRPSGGPIQPLSLVHEAGYSDYSHGVRLVAATARVDGRDVPLAAALRDPALASLLSAEGPLRLLRVP